MPATTPLTKDQAEALSRSFHDVAAAIDDFRSRQATVLTDTQQFQLETASRRCLQFSNHFIAMSMFAQEEDLDATLQAIAEGTERANAAIRTIRMIDKALQIATAAAILGESIAALNPSAIESGLKGLVSAVAGENGDQDTSGSGDN